MSDISDFLYNLVNIKTPSAVAGFVGLSMYKADRVAQVNRQLAYIEQSYQNYNEGLSQQMFDSRGEMMTGPARGTTQSVVKKPFGQATLADIEVDEDKFFQKQLEYIIKNTTNIDARKEMIQHLTMKNIANKKIIEQRWNVAADHEAMASLNTFYSTVLASNDPWEIKMQKIASRVDQMVLVGRLHKEEGENIKAKATAAAQYSFAHNSAVTMMKETNDPVAVETWLEENTPFYDNIPKIRKEIADDVWKAHRVVQGRLDEAAWEKGSNEYYRGELTKISQVEKLQDEGLDTEHANTLKSWIVAGNKAAIAEYEKKMEKGFEIERKNIISKIEYDIDEKRDPDRVQKEILENAEMLGEIKLRDLITKNNKRVWSDPAYKRALDFYLNARKNGTLSEEQQFNMQDQFRKHFDPLIFKPDGTLREDRPKPEDIMDYADSMIQPSIEEFIKNVMDERLQPFGYKRGMFGLGGKYKEKWGDLPGDVEEIQDIEQYEKWISEGVYRDLSPEQLKQHQPLFERVRKEQEWHYKRWSKHDWNEAGELKSTDLTDYGHAVFTDINDRKWAFYIVNNNEVLKEWTPLDKTPAGETGREYPVLGQYEVPIENEETGEIIIFNRKTGERRLYER